MNTGRKIAVIAAVMVGTVLWALVLFTPRVHAAAPRPYGTGCRCGTSLSQFSGPSQSFLTDWGEDREYILTAGRSYSRYEVYASGILDDGTVIYAAKGSRFIAVTPSGTLIEGSWGLNGTCPERAYSGYSFEPSAEQPHSRRTAPSSREKQ